MILVTAVTPGKTSTGGLHKQQFSDLWLLPLSNQPGNDQIRHFKQVQGMPD
jgi:hypothetical protein